jgi:FADH2-dependent halogenase
METVYDVVILGGGPAGSAAATTLARGGRKVLVLEREKFPRFKIGESLLPGSTEIFDRLGLREKLDARFIIKHGAEIATSCGSFNLKFYFREGLQVSYPTAYQVTRSEFDQILLDHAAENGAEIRHEVQVERVDFDPEGGTVKLKGGETVRAKFVIDTTGRNSILGTQFGLKKSYAHLQKFAVYAHYENVDREEGIDGSLIRVIRAQDRWFWMIPLTETRMSIGVVMDMADFKRYKTPPEKFLEEAIAEQPVITERMRHATRATEVYAAGDYSYRNTRMSGERWVLAGDAAGFIDPVFSTGVFMALVSGEDSAKAAEIVLTRPDLAPKAFAKYEKKLNGIMDFYLRFVSAWYRPEFIEVFIRPERRFQLPEAINSVLSGNISPSWAVRWRLALFYLVVKIQKRFPLCPRLDLTPGEPKNPQPFQKRKEAV